MAGTDANNAVVNGDTTRKSDNENHDDDADDDGSDLLPHLQWMSHPTERRSKGRETEASGKANNNMEEKQSQKNSSLF